MNNAEKLARKFHDTYERLAPDFGYETRDDTKAFDPTTPNGKLMIAVCGELASDVKPANKETSSRVSTIAGKYLHFGQADLLLLDEKGQGELVTDLRILAGSVLSQDETPGQEIPPVSVRGAILDNLKKEREDLDTRLQRLDAALLHNLPDWPDALMMQEQSRLMSELLAVLDQRITDLEISTRGDASTKENDNAE